MLLATINYTPYVFDVDKDVSIRETNFKRYTFRDIQQLEDRIKTLEYYTQLSLLESETASMEIRDTSGLSRFKNGFVVDNFASLSTSDTLHQDYRVSLILMKVNVVHLITLLKYLLHFLQHLLMYSKLEIL